MSDFIQSRLINKAVTFNDRLKRVKLKILPSDGVIKNINFNTMPLLIHYSILHKFMLHTLISDMFFKQCIVLPAVI